MRFLAVLFAVLAVAAGGLWIWDHQSRTLQIRYDSVIQAAARDYGVDPLLVRAVIWRETRFNPAMVGHDDERGLMQVTPAVGGEWAKVAKIDAFQVADLFNPQTNIRAGTWYLSRSLRRWPNVDDPLPFALAEYNAGRSNTLRWVDPQAPLDSRAFLARIDYPTTRRYIETIRRKYQEYQAGYFRPPWMGYWERLVGPEKN